MILYRVDSFSITMHPSDGLPEHEPPCMRNPLRPHIEFGNTLRVEAIVGNRIKSDIGKFFGTCPGRCSHPISLFFVTVGWYGLWISSTQCLNSHFQIQSGNKIKEWFGRLLWWRMGLEIFHFTSSQNGVSTLLILVSGIECVCGHCCVNVFSRICYSKHWQHRNRTWSISKYSRNCNVLTHTGGIKHDNNPGDIVQGPQPWHLKMQWITRLINIF